MRRILSVLALLVIVVTAAWAADAPALPDYTVAPFSKFGDCEGPPSFHPDWSETTCEMFTNTPAPAPDASAVYVTKGADGKLKYAIWLHVQQDGCVILRGYNRTNEKWVFEAERRPCEEQQKK